MAALPISSNGPGMVRLLCTRALRSLGDASITLPNGRSMDVPAENITFSMPAEWAPHQGCWIAWPRRHDVWRAAAVPAKKAFTDVILAINRFEPVTVVAPNDLWLEARAALPDSIRVLEMTIDDSWLRDSGPTFVEAKITSCPKPAIRTLLGMDWVFNGWGGLYGSYEQDKLVAAKVCEAEGLPYVSTDFVLEGGSIHVDGEGTLLTTEECLLNPNRNPGLSKADIEARLKRFTGVSKVIWLPKGLYKDDDTNGHIDNFACFARPGVVLLAWCDDPSDPQHAISSEALQLLEQETDAKGRKLQVIKLPCPPPLQRTEEEWNTLSLEGRENRHAGERLAASYANFYIANGAIIMPAFGLSEADAEAQAVLKQAFPDREVVAVQTREIVLGGGNIHCITQQQPMPVQSGA